MLIAHEDRLNTRLEMLIAHEDRLNIRLEMLIDDGLVIIAKMKNCKKK